MSRSDPTTARTRVEELTLALCAIPSITGDEAACAERVAALLGPTPFQVERIGLSILARSPPRGRPLVLLVGHTDTVPGPPGAERVGSRIVGLGASDM